MKKQYTNPNTEISWWVGDNLCDGTLYTTAPENEGRGGSPVSKINQPSGN